ncbi:hypothetical protein ALC53_08766, partial [Atta colombica]
ESKNWREQIKEKGEKIMDDKERVRERKRKFMEILNMYWIKVFYGMSRDGCVAKYPADLIRSSRELREHRGIYKPALVHTILLFIPLRMSADSQMR